MPKWDIDCRTCGMEFEFFKLRSDDTTECPNCGEKEEKKLSRKVPTGTDYIPVGPNWMKKGRNGY